MAKQTDAKEPIFSFASDNIIFPMSFPEKNQDSVLLSDENTDLSEDERELQEAIHEITAFDPQASSPTLTHASSGFIQPPVIHKTPLHTAAAHGDVDKIRALIASGAKVNEENHKSAMPLAVASMNGHNEAVKVLLSYGADVHDKSYKGETALHWAIVNYHPDIVKTLLNAGANVHEKNMIGGLTPINLAVAQLNHQTDLLIKNMTCQSETIQKIDQMIRVIEHIADHTTQTLYAKEDSTKANSPEMPVSMLLQIQAGYVCHDLIRDKMLTLSQKLATPSEEARYLDAKLFLSIFPVADEYRAKLSPQKNVIVQADGFYPQFTTQAFAGWLDQFYKANVNDNPLTRKIFANMSIIFSQAAHDAQHFNAYETAENVLSRFHRGETVLLPTGWHGHSIAVILSKSQGFFAISNAGMQYKDVGEQAVGVKFYHLVDAENVSIDHIHQILANQDQSQMEMKLFHTLTTSDLVGMIETPPQASGNCTFYSFKIAVEAIAMIEYLNAGINPNEASKLAHLYSEQFEVFFNQLMIDKMAVEDSAFAADLRIFDDVKTLLTKDAEKSHFHPKTVEHFLDKCAPHFSTGEVKPSTPSSVIKPHDVFDYFSSKLKFAKAEDATDSTDADELQLLAQQSDSQYKSSVVDTASYHLPDTDGIMPHLTHVDEVFS